MNRKFLALSIFFILLVSTIGLAQESVDSVSDGYIGASYDTYLNSFQKLISGVLVTQASIGGKSCPTGNTDHYKMSPVTLSSTGSGKLKLSHSSETRTESVYYKILDVVLGDEISNGYIKRGSSFEIQLTKGRAYNIFWYECGATASQPTGDVYCYDNLNKDCTLLQSGRTSCGFLEAVTGSNSKTDCLAKTKSPPSTANEEKRCLDFGAVVTTVCASNEEKITSISGKTLSLSTGKVCCLKKTGTPDVKIQPVIPDSSTPQPSSGTDFELSNLVRITGLDGFKTTNVKLSYAVLFGDDNVYRVTVKNIGTSPQSTQLEGFHVSLTNPKYNDFVSGISSASQLQSVLDIEGISENVQTCKGEQAVKSYTVSTLAPQESKEFFIVIPNPKKTDNQGLPVKLAGYDNFNPDGKYLLVVNSYDKCGGTVYDSIGGSLKFTLNLDGEVDPLSPITGTVGTEQTCDPTTLIGCPPKPSIRADKIDSVTDTERLEALCKKSSECDNNNCVNLKKLEDDGDITSSEGDEIVNKMESTLTGLSTGALIGAGTCVAVASTAVGLGSLGVGALLASPIILGTCAGAGGIAGTIIGYWTEDVTDAISKGNKASYGFCVEESESPTGIGGFTKSIGKTVNDAFDDPLADNSTVGWIVVVALGIIAIAVITKK